MVGDVGKSSHLRTRYCLSWKQVDNEYILDYLKGEMSFCLCNLLSRLPLIGITFWFNVYSIMKLFLSLLVLLKLSRIIGDLVLTVFPQQQISIIYFLWQLFLLYFTYFTINVKAFWGFPWGKGKYQSNVHGQTVYICWSYST